MRFQKTVAIFAAVLCLSVPAFSAAPSFSLDALKGLAGSDEFGMPDTQPTSGWQELVIKVAKNGTFTPGAEDIPSTLGLKKITGAENATHQSEYINLWGFVDESGTFAAFMATLVSEKWTLKGEVWTVEQRMHILDMAGDPQRATKAVIVEKTDGQVLDYKSEPAEVGDADVAAHRNAVLDMWKAFKPAAK
ncbi:MAG: hypothetical protein HY924_11860 [Elusimicrobia bacterium]|nr:hypothetical protein [Elusimicrobiota bacterium]